ncbi:MAG: hypothetical protein ACE14V_01360 [bacterium]
MTDVLKIYNTIFTPSYNYGINQSGELYYSWKLFYGEAWEHELLECSDSIECGSEISIDAKLSQFFYLGGTLRGSIIIDSVTSSDYSPWCTITGVGVGSYTYKQSDYWEKQAAKSRATNREPYKPVWSWSWDEFNGF